MLSRRLLYLTSLILLFNSVILSAQEECDDPDAPEDVRIYFGNGMFNDGDDRAAGLLKLRSVVGETSGRSWGSALNSNEFFMRQLLQVAGQKGFEARDAWYYVDHPEIEPNPLAQDIAKAYRDAANIQYFLDHELRKMVSDYVNDMNSGKKVVVVAHSQGNFYANSAYEYIKNNYPDYRNSIGLVGVGTPSVRVQDGGDYFQNSADKVINDVRDIDPNVLSPNFTYIQPWPPESPVAPNNHSFTDTYLAAVPVSIGSSVSNTINRLVKPIKKPECENPDDVPVTLGLIYATNITTSTATISTEVLSGKDITVWTKVQRLTHPLACSSDAGQKSENGPFNTGDVAYYDASDLREDSTYYVRTCAKGTLNRIWDTGVASFKTKDIDPVVETRDPLLVSSSGFTAVTGVLQGSNVTVATYFNTDRNSLENACVDGKRFWCNGTQPKIDAGDIYYWRFKNGYYYSDDYGNQTLLNMSNRYYVVGCGCKNGVVSSGVVKRVN